MNEFSFEIKRLLKWSGFVVIILGIFLLFAALNAFKTWHAPSPAFNSISVTGKGESVTVPDVATFSFTVSADATSVGGAQDQVTKKMDLILQSLADLNIAKADIKTTDYTVWPKYTYTSGVCTQNSCPPSRQIADGYTVNHSVQVKIRKTDDAGKALGLVGGKGATNVSSLNFTSDDPNKALNEARAKAIDDAKAKAEDLADHLGVRLVRVVGYYDSNGPFPMYESASAGPTMLKAQDAVSSPTVPSGENKTTVNVTVNYEIR
ncbi:MAG: hypothetical protein JWN89_657 [Parcubacteria group bacterium]|nr:hypothetical protein [Parcubacteria group bacterium]